MPEIIQSAQNTRVQTVRSLLEQSKARRKSQAFVAEGVRLLEEGLSSTFPLQFVLYRSDPSERVASLLQKLPRSSPCFELLPALFDDLADTSNSQGVLGVFSILESDFPAEPNFILIADQLRDPGNMGTILRTAEAAGVQAVLLPPGNADPWAPKVLRAGMGAHFRLPILQYPWSTIATFCAPLRILHADMDGAESCWQTNMLAPLALLIGGEAEGISAEARPLVSQSVRIPMAGATESMNAAIAAALLMFEVSRQRNSPLA